MGRPRKHDTGLPPKVYFRHGAYYYVTKGQWIRLGDTVPKADVLQQMLAEKEPMSREAIEEYAKRVMVRARCNARGRRKIEFSLEWPDVLSMLERGGWRCSVTGVKFTLEIAAGRRPFAPSIDRIDSSRGYIPDNCRIVCVAANYAMNVWGSEVLMRMLLSAKRQHSIGRQIDNLGQNQSAAQ